MNTRNKVTTRKLVFAGISEPTIRLAFEQTAQQIALMEKQVEALKKEVQKLKKEV